MAVSLELPKTHFQQGEVLTGTIHVKANIGGELSLTIEGIEKVKFIWFKDYHYYSGTGLKRRRRVRLVQMRSEKCRFFCKTTGKHKIVEGNYSVPFSVKLPKKIPNSFEFNHSTFTTGSISYCIIAQGPGSDPHKVPIWIERSVFKGQSPDGIKS